MTSQEQKHYVGERLSLKGQLCTVCYIGLVAGKPGIWLGVEWDDPGRGKNDGSHDGTVYFECRSESRTAGSFLRPTQSFDSPRTFLEALQQKYMPEFRENTAEIVYISGKQAEEIGFEKFSRRQAKLQGIHVLVLDNMRIRHRLTNIDDVSSIQEICADITELDLSDNLFETFEEIVQLCNLFPKLKALTLDGNRFAVDTNTENAILSTLTSLSVSRMLLNLSEVNRILSSTPSLRTLAVANNHITDCVRLNLPSDLNALDLSDNNLSSLHSLQTLVPCPTTLILKRNKISAISAGTDSTWCLAVSELDVTYNNIKSWAFFNAITNKTFPILRHLRVTGNPLYESVVSADGRSLTSEDGYMLTIARLPQLDFLNYAKITEKERLNAETYYLGQIAIELSKTPVADELDVISRHPRYYDLCEEYGEPLIQRRPSKDEIDPNSLAAKMISVTFTITPTILPIITQRTWIEEIPKSFNIYYVLGIVGKRLNVLPLDLRLVLETSERDPALVNADYDGPEWWDSSDDEAGDVGGEWMKREIELVPGTRALGTYVDGSEATVRIESLSKDG